MPGNWVTWHMKYKYDVCLSRWKFFSNVVFKWKRKQFFQFRFHFRSVRMKVSGMLYMFTHEILTRSNKLISFRFLTIALADLRGGARDARPPLWVQILSFSCSFWEILGKIIGWRPHLGGWRPPVWEILDPPLNCKQQNLFGFLQ